MAGAGDTTTTHACSEVVGPSFRVGHGWDLHRLEPRAAGRPARPLVVGCVTLDHDHGPISHSDGDVLLHALTAALLGALALPDIGELFPDHDPRHESRDSAEFLRAAAALVRDEGWRPVNADCTVILERPRVSVHKGAMRERIAAILRVPTACVNVKGKSHERVDAVGEGRAIEAHAVVLLERITGPVQSPDSRSAPR